MFKYFVLVVISALAWSPLQTASIAGETDFAEGSSFMEGVLADSEGSYFGLSGNVHTLTSTCIFAKEQLIVDFEIDYIISVCVLN